MLLSDQGSMVQQERDPAREMDRDLPMVHASHSLSKVAAHRETWAEPRRAVARFSGVQDLGFDGARAF
jgi:hypothetical protein